MKDQYKWYSMFYAAPIYLLMLLPSRYILLFPTVFLLVICGSVTAKRWCTRTFVTLSPEKSEKEIHHIAVGIIIHDRPLSSKRSNTNDE